MIQQYCTLFPHSLSTRLRFARWHPFVPGCEVHSFVLSLSLEDNIILYCIICTSATSSSGSSGVKQNVEMRTRWWEKGPREQHPLSRVLRHLWREAGHGEIWRGRSALGILQFCWQNLTLTEFDSWFVLTSLIRNHFFHYVVLTKSIWNHDQNCIHQAHWSTTWSP